MTLAGSDIVDGASEKDPSPQQEKAVHDAIVKRLVNRRKLLRKIESPAITERIILRIKQAKQKKKPNPNKKYIRWCYEHKPLVNTCPECGKKWTISYEKRRSAKAKYCSAKCKCKANDRRYLAELRENRRLFPKRKYRIDQIIDYLRNNPPSTRSQIAAAIGISKNNVTRAILGSSRGRIVSKRSGSIALLSLATAVVDV